jgi:colicin import membrane protein
MTTQLATVTEYEEFRAKIAGVKETCNFLPDVASTEGYEKSKRVALDVGKILTNLESRRKELKQDSLEFGRRVDSQAKDIAAELESFQLPHKRAYKELDNLKKEREARRKAELAERVEFIATLPEMMRDSDSDSVKAALEGLHDNECLDFYEFTDQALKARKSSITALSEMFGQKLQQEKEAVELERLRQESAAREQQDREDRIANEAREEAERKAADAKEEAEKRERDLKAKAKEAEENAQREIQAAADKADREKQRVVDEKLKREANKRHVGGIRREAKEAMVSGGIDEAVAKKIILAISNGAIPHITINY